MSRENQQPSLAWKAGRIAGMARRKVRRVWRAAVSAEPRGSQDPELARWYANLEVPYGSDLQTVSRARKRMLARYHPDLHARDSQQAQKAGELTLAINDAYEQLVARLSR